MRRCFGLWSVLCLLAALATGCHHTAGICDCAQWPDRCNLYGGQAHAPAQVIPASAAPEQIQQMPH